MFRIRVVGLTTIVAVQGELDMFSSPGLGTQIFAVERSSPRLIVSLAECTYCDATGLTELVRAFSRIGNRLAVVLPKRPQPRLIFELSGLNRRLPLASLDDGAFAQNSM